MKVPWQQNISLNSYHTTEVDGHLLSKRKKKTVSKYKLWFCTARQADCRSPVTQKLQLKKEGVDKIISSQFGIFGILET